MLLITELTWFAWNKNEAQAVVFFNPIIIDLYKQAIYLGEKFISML